MKNMFKKITEIMMSALMIFTVISPVQVSASSYTLTKKQSLVDVLDMSSISSGHVAYVSLSGTDDSGNSVETPA